jgi:glycosyltransferase involved in cell wall biosynthesis
MKVLVLLTEAFGGNGGIALYNRDLLTALCAHPGFATVVAVPRLMPEHPGSLPTRLEYLSAGINSKPAYLHTLVHAAWRERCFDLIVCGHINLVPLACALGLCTKTPVLLAVYGIDAWRPTRSAVTNALVRRVDAFVSISELTRRRFLGWAKPNRTRGFVLPNAIHTEHYAPGPKNPDLLQRYGLAGKTVLMTLGRMWSSERYLKGFDRVLDALPDLARQIPNVAYLAAGDGDDRPRLEDKARSLGVADRVVFPGHIAESEKADHYRLADAFVMPSEGEGFGFVFLEAMACGIPVVASKTDGGREALRDGALGILVDPANPDELKAGVLAALQRPRLVPPALEYFSFDNFSRRLHSIVDEVVGARPVDRRPST